MTDVVRLRTETWERLQRFATPFRSSELGTPDKVISMLLDVHEGPVVGTLADEHIDGSFDEDGFHLYATIDDRDLDVRVAGTEEARRLLAAVEPLREWVAEHDHEYAAYVVASPAERARVLGRALDLDDPDAYEERAEAIREGGDLARKAERERS